ncbi:MAG: FAD-dependent oxidoreductase [Candidatus Heimdallarchaeum aukensis]|uniref:FAD-dependent oxidoreductase n=1 Tax=Candidatus Heimdallarchaeum aukensis TaxID=2876573 RepID=A0A9Y1FMG3_9ARCH|nr:MAG: FAD-dependent oxidoreductase [Candidatus Heimdallarchaeum aukensis]
MNRDGTIDLAIIGSGLTGLSAAIAAYSKNPDLKIKLFGIPYDTNTAKKGTIDTIPGVESVVGVDYIVQILGQIEKFNNEYISYFSSSDEQDDNLKVKEKRIEIEEEEISKIIKEEDFVLVTEDGESFKAKAVILAYDLPELKGAVKGEEEFEGQGLSYCAVCDGALFRGKKVCIIGKDNFAARGALFLRKYCRKVTVLCPSSTLDIDKRFMKKLEKSPNVKIKYGIDLSKVEVVGSQFVTGIKFVEDGEEKELSVNAVFIELKDKPDFSMLKELDIRIDEEGFLETNNIKETNIPGLFAAGVITGEKDYCAILMGEGYKAGINAVDYITKK